MHEPSLHWTVNTGRHTILRQMVILRSSPSHSCLQLIYGPCTWVIDGMTELCIMAAAYCHNGSMQLLMRTKILDHQVRFLTAIVLVFVRSPCCNFYFYFVLVLCPAISFRFRFRYENRSVANATVDYTSWLKIVRLRQAFQNSSLLGSTP